MAVGGGVMSIAQAASMGRAVGSWRGGRGQALEAPQLPWGRSPLQGALASMWGFISCISRAKALTPLP